MKTKKWRSHAMLVAERRVSDYSSEYQYYLNKKRKHIDIIILMSLGFGNFAAGGHQGFRSALSSRRTNVFIAASSASSKLTEFPLPIRAMRSSGWATTSLPPVGERWT
jgi:hypothetical protein